MIESIHIEDIPYFSEASEELGELSKINFIYGPNGSGKTTISRVIADESKFDKCSIKWAGGKRLQTIVYNRDFVKQNFSQEKLKGIFTLGKENIETTQKIQKLKKEIGTLNEKIASLDKDLKGEDDAGGKEGELDTLKKDFVDTCWSQKIKHDENFKYAFTRFRADKEKFKTKILEELESNSTELKTLDYLKSKAKTVFKENPTEYKTIPSIQKKEVLNHEANSILKKKIIGKEDVDIAAMTQKLGNSDWVKSGLTFFEENDSKICPFCQQGTSDAFAKSLSEYFDETFQKDSETVTEMATSYKTDSEQFTQQIQSIIEDRPKFLNIEQLQSKKEVLDQIIQTNIQKIEMKKKEPSQEITLETVTDVISQIESLIQNANISISEHNKEVQDINRERQTLTRQVWKYIVEEELKNDIDKYKINLKNLNSDICDIKKEIRSNFGQISEKNLQIQNFEKDITSIQPTIDEINSTLSSFGFTGFSLAKSEEGNSYKTIRKGGDNAKETLSEGEERFLTFLYFYHLLKGSQSESEIGSDCVVVFDDPVSSLDSEILFVVSSMIKNLFGKIKQEKENIKQVFVLTHNVYFHKEVTYEHKKSKKKERTFWIIRKLGLEQKLKKFESNPVKTSYELLWVDIKSNKNSCSSTIQNTMRRILEYYFEILGGINKDQICEKFQGEEKTICNSLFSWANAGSHFPSDDLYISSGHSDDVYLKVFKKIFENSGHIAHYDMMMQNVP